MDLQKIRFKVEDICNRLWDSKTSDSQKVFDARRHLNDLADSIQILEFTHHLVCKKEVKL